MLAFKPNFGKIRFETQKIYLRERRIFLWDVEKLMFLENTKFKGNRPKGK